MKTSIIVVSVVFIGFALIAYLILKEDPETNYTTQMNTQQIELQRSNTLTNLASLIPFI